GHGHADGTAVGTEDDGHFVFQNHPAHVGDAFGRFAAIVVRYHFDAIGLAAENEPFPFDVFQSQLNSPPAVRSELRSRPGKRSAVPNLHHRLGAGASPSQGKAYQYGSHPPHPTIPSPSRAHWASLPSRTTIDFYYSEYP